jgi:hypothetical protein
MAQYLRQNMVDFNTTFGPLFREHNVDIYHAGHVHNYERTLPLGGVLHLTNGAAGDTEACDAFPGPFPPWSAHRYSYGARCSTECCTRGCHRLPRLLAHHAFRHDTDDVATLKGVWVGRVVRKHDDAGVEVLSKQGWCARGHLVQDEGVKSSKDGVLEDTWSKTKA